MFSCYNQLYLTDFRPTSRAAPHNVTVPNSIINSNAPGTSWVIVSWISTKIGCCQCRTIWKYCIRVTPRCPRFTVDTVNSHWHLASITHGVISNITRASTCCNDIQKHSQTNVVTFMIFLMGVSVHILTQCPPPPGKYGSCLLKVQSSNTCYRLSS